MYPGRGPVLSPALLASSSSPVASVAVLGGAAAAPGETSGPSEGLGELAQTCQCGELIITLKAPKKVKLNLIRIQLPINMRIMFTLLFTLLLISHRPTDVE